MEHVTLEERAAALLAKHGADGIPVPAEEIAVKEGAQVARNRFNGIESGFMLRDTANQVVMIGLNTRTSSRRQRCSLGHSLGHLLMHEGKIIVRQSVRLRRLEGVASAATDEQEAEANAFSAALLMPREAIIAAVGAFTSETAPDEAHFPRDEMIDQLARKFDVSSEAMIFRLASLGILGV
jgi:Zn-dependent peptidase ImmA (M78 family)